MQLRRSGWVVLAGLGAMLLALMAVAKYGLFTGVPLAASVDAGPLGDASDGADWPAFGRTYGEQHYSPLDSVNAGNVKELGLVWSQDIGPGNSMTGPIAVDGTIYFASAYSLVHAIDAQSGRIKWTYDPKAPEASGRKLRQGWGSRGIAWWNGKVYTGTQDGRLIAIDTDTGKPVWSVLTTQKGDYRFISGAPRVFDGKVIIGHGGADASNVRGYVTAYDAETGKQLWRFYTVPGQPGVDKDETTRIAAKSWAGEWWKHGGGGTVWNAITYDAALDQIYIGTGNGAPWNHRIRSKGVGDNLFVSSIVALDARTGAYKWHYQTNPGETWDYNASMDMALADLKIAGKPRQVLMTAPKNGFFYVIDRKTGKLVSAEPYVKVTWASKIDLKSGRPVENPDARFADKPFLMAPSTFGAHTWLPMAYSPQSRLVYLPAIDMSAMFDERGIDTKKWVRTPDNVLDNGENVIYDFTKTIDSELIAWDPVTQRARWKVRTQGFMAGGVMATGGGLVFQGEIDGKFSAYDAASGQKLWSFDARSPVMAPPITYTVNGRQYVTVLTGMGTAGAFVGPLLEKYGLDPRKQARRVLTFAIGGKAKLPATERGKAHIMPDPDYVANADAEARGFMLYAQRCSVCHGAAAIAVGVAPDLRASAVARDFDSFRAVLKDGLMVAGGMPQFDELNDEQIRLMQAYIRGRAAAALSSDREKAQ